MTERQMLLVVILQWSLLTSFVIPLVALCFGVSDVPSVPFGLDTMALREGSWTVQ